MPPLPPSSGGTVGFFGASVVGSVVVVSVDSVVGLFRRRRRLRRLGAFGGLRGRGRKRFGAGCGRAAVAVAAGDHHDGDDQTDDDRDQAGDEQAQVAVRAVTVGRGLRAPSGGSGPRASDPSPPARGSRRGSRRCPRSRTRFAAATRSHPGCCPRPPSGWPAAVRRRGCLARAGAARPRPLRLGATALRYRPLAAADRIGAPVLAAILRPRRAAASLPPGGATRSSASPRTASACPTSESVDSESAARRSATRRSASACASSRRRLACSSASSITDTAARSAASTMAPIRSAAAAGERLCGCWAVLAFHVRRQP